MLGALDGPMCAQIAADLSGAQNKTPANFVKGQFWQCKWQCAAGVPSAPVLSAQKWQNQKPRGPIKNTPRQTHTQSSLHRCAGGQSPGTNAQPNQGAAPSVICGQVGVCTAQR